MVGSFRHEHLEREAWCQLEESFHLKTLTARARPNTSQDQERVASLPYIFLEDRLRFSFSSERIDEHDDVLRSIPHTCKLTDITALFSWASG